MTLSWLVEIFRSDPNKTALIWKGRSVSYQCLLDQMDHWRARLDRNEVPEGTVVSLEADYSPQAVALLLVLTERNNIIVPLATSIATDREEFRRIAQVQFRIGIREDAEISFQTTSDRPVTNPLLLHLIEQQQPGLVLFSSGSTGRSKAALHNFAVLLEKFQTRRNRLTTLAFLLLDHIGGINTLMYVLSNLGTLVCVESRDPDTVCRAISRHRVELLPTSPTFLNLLLISEAHNRFDLSSLKRITYGTEVMPEPTLQRVRHVLPRVELQQTYGLSEVGILRSKSKSCDSLWVKVGGDGFETKVEQGTLWVKARSAMMGYLNAASPFDADGWLNTGDAVETDGEYIRILGRRSELINVGGEKVYPTEIENVLLEMPNVSDVSVRAEPNPITGGMVVARFTLINPEEPAVFRKRTREYCQTRLAAYKIPARIEIADNPQYTARFKKVRYPTIEETRHTL